MSETNYLKLKYISLMSTRWFQDFNSNLARLDLLGKAIRIQQGAGLSMGLRTELSDGTLVEPIRAVPNSNSGVDLYLGRPQTGDRVIIQAPTGGVGSRVIASAISLAFQARDENLWTADVGSLDLSSELGGWDIEALVHVGVQVLAPAAPLSLKVEVGLFPVASITPVQMASFTFDCAAVATTKYQSVSLKALGAVAGTAYTVRMRFGDITGGIAPGDGASVSMAAVSTSGEISTILATRVA
jgi:hypothetical protein